jgi:hypothetical protein
MTKMLDVLQDYCWMRDYKVSRLDGSVSYQDREVQVSKAKPTTLARLIARRSFQPLC